MENGLLLISKLAGLLLIRPCTKVTCYFADCHAQLNSQADVFVLAVVLAYMQTNHRMNYRASAKERQ